MIDPLFKIDTTDPERPVLMMRAHPAPAEGADAQGYVWCARSMPLAEAEEIGMAIIYAARAARLTPEQQQVPIVGVLTGPREHVHEMPATLSPVPPEGVKPMYPPLHTYEGCVQPLGCAHHRKQYNQEHVARDRYAEARENQLKGDIDFWGVHMYLEREDSAVCKRCGWSSGERIHDVTESRTV